MRLAAAHRHRRTRGVDSRPEPVYRKDAELLKLCKAGDEAAWRELVGRYKDLLYSIPRRYGLDQDDAADVFQAVFVSLWKGLPSLRSERALTRWIETAARRQSERLALKNRRKLGDGDLAASLGSQEPEALEAVQAAEEEHRVRLGLAELGGRCGELLKLLYIEEPPCSYDEITRRLGVPRGSVGPIRGRCLEKLRDILRKTS